MSKNCVGKVLELFISQQGEERRLSKDQLLLDFGGVVDDKFYNKDIKRSVLLATTDSYILAKENGIEMKFGTLGENILVDFNPYSLEIGTQLKIGDVILEITQECTICNHLSIIDKKLPKLLKKDRGIFTKVAKIGLIKKDDKVYLL